MTETTGGSAAPEAGGGGMSTGTKLVLGCLGLIGLGFVAVSIAFWVGGMALKRGVESAFGGLDEHLEASEILGRLETEHPFEVPGDGVVTEERLLRFLAATDGAWDELESWATETAALGDRAGSGEAGGLGDMLSGAKSLAGGARARIVLAESLEEAEISLGEYVWTGLTMDRAAKAAERPTDQPGVPAANRALLERYGPRVPRLNEDEAEGEASEAGGRGTVLGVAILWGMTELSTWKAMGLDTLGAAVSR